MGKILSRLLYQPYEDHLMFLCPGCQEHHTVAIENGSGKGWQWNKDVLFPTFYPSIKVSFVKATPEGEKMMQDRTPLPEGVDRYPCTDEVCHSFVKDGNIQFLEDCTHPLAGCKIPIPQHKFNP